MEAGALEFPPFRLDLLNQELWRDGERLALRPKPFAVLAFLATHPQRLVPHAELVRAVWPDTHVGEGLLRGYVRDVRTVLDDDPAQPRFIETVPRRGYRFIAAVRATDRAPAAVGDVAAPDDVPPSPGMVGRRAELAELERRLVDTLAGERQVVFVTGEPGMGKTTLVDAFVARRLAGHDVWTARGQCVEHFGASEAYLPLLEALGRLGRSPARDTLVAVFARHAPTWLAQLPALVADADLEAVQRRVQGATRERMLREFAEGVEVLTATQPLVLVLEDLQWSDASTLDLLSSLAQRRGRAHLLVLCTHRPADVVAGTHPLAAIQRELRLRGCCVDVALSPLGVDDVAAYVAERFRGTIAPELPLAIHDATEGNPLFVVNLVDYWLAHGLLAEEDGRWGLAGATDAATGVPDTLRQLIERQLDRLGPEVPSMLEAASVAGREFSTAAVAAALEEAQDRVDAWCERLDARGLFVRARGVEALAGGEIAGRYEFLHALYRQVLYERLAPTRRVRLHRRIGEWVEAAYGSGAQDHAAELAVHFERGHDPRAMGHLEAAARNAMRKHAYREATAVLGRALDLLAATPDGAERGRRELSLQMALGTSMLMTRGYAAPEVERAFTRARELTVHVDDTSERLFALAGLFRFFFGGARLASARDVSNQVLALVEGQDPSLLAVAHSMAGLPLLSFGELAAARAHLEQAIARYDLERHRSIAPQHGDDPALTSLGFLSIALWFLGHPDQALARSLEGQALAAKLAAPYSTAFATSFRCWVHVRRGEPDAARACCEALVALADEHGFGFFRAEADVFRGWSLAEEGQADAGIALIRDGLASHRAAGTEMGRPSHLALLAEACARARRLDEGLAVLDEALATLAATGEHAYEAELHRLKGDLLCRQPRRGRKDAAVERQAEASIRQAVAIARRQGAKALELRAVSALCRLRPTAEARRLVADVAARFTEGLDTADLRAARALADAPS